MSDFEKDLNKGVRDENTSEFDENKKVPDDGGTPSGDGSDNGSGNNSNPTLLAPKVPDKTLDQIIREETDSYVESLDPDLSYDPVQVSTDLVKKVAKACRDYNNSLNENGVKRKKDEWVTVPKKLCPNQIASIMLQLYYIVRVKCGGENADPSYDLLAIYQTSGPDEGIYITDEGEFKRIAIQYCYTLTSRELSDVMELITLKAPRRQRTMDRDLIAVNNGVFDFENKILLPFNPQYVFLAKSKVNYNPKAVNVVIHNDVDGTDWDVESWMQELSDDPEIVNVLWEIMSAIVRPFVRWNKSAWLYSNTGNNGKGTLCELMRSLCGDGSYAAIPLTDFGKDFALEPLTRANAIIVDENDVGAFIDKAANLKAVITNDVIPINRKFKTAISYQFYGFMVQCLNEFPRIKDKSDSFYRRQLFIPFDKCFTGHERKYIKTDYLHRDDVLQYVLYRVLNMNFYSLSEPASCANALDEYKDFNDPVRQFMDEMLPQLVWDLIPFSFLYDLYKAWFRKTSPSGSIQGRNTFITDILNILKEYPEWYCQGRSVPVRPGNKMDKTEELIADYALTDWYNPVYTGQDRVKLCSPKLKTTYNGLLRNGVPMTDQD